jgi:serine/threonine-protein kinase
MVADREDNRTSAFEAPAGAGEGGATRPDSTRPVPFDSQETASEHLDVQARVEAAVMATEAQARPATDDPLLGRLIGGRFQVVSRIGAGGMGIVYKARQVGMDRFVAVKVLLRELAHDEKVVKRFKIEALAVSRLNHPNTIRIFDFGQTEDGVLYFAMEFLEGRSLERALHRDGPMSAARTLHILKQITASLAEAHEKGIVHRDLKPDNIYLTPVGSDPDFVKVLDFGVAKLREADKRQGTVTQAGTIFGTPRYMAPEQCRSQLVDHRADIYAVGIIAYEMLTGKAPFDAESPLSILIQHVQEAPPRLAAVRPDVKVPEVVEDLVMRCLEKAPDRRFATALDLQRDAARLEAEVAGKYQQVVFVNGPRDARETRPVEVVASAETVPGLAPAGTGRRRWAAWAGVAALACAGVVAAFASGVFSTGTDAVETAAPAPATVAVSTSSLPPPAPMPAAAAPAAPARVTVTFSSTPDGAEVLDEGRRLGVTPFSVDFDTGKGPREFVFRKAGFRDATSKATLRQNESLSVAMARAPAAAAKAPAPGAGSPAPAATTAPAPPPKKDDGPSKVGDLKKAPY